MIRKIVVNLLVSFVLFPLFIFLKDLVIIKELRYFGYGYAYDKEIPYDYLRLFTNEYIFGRVKILGNIFFLILILLPFQIIKSYYFHKHNKGLNLWKKCLILFGIISGVFAFLFRPPMTEMQERIELFATLLAIATVVALLLYLVVDRYAERPRVKEN